MKKKCIQRKNVNFVQKILIKLLWKLMNLLAQRNHRFVSIVIKLLNQKNYGVIKKYVEQKLHSVEHAKSLSCEKIWKGMMSMNVWDRWRRKDKKNQWILNESDKDKCKLSQKDKTILSKNSKKLKPRETLKDRRNTYKISKRKKKMSLLNEKMKRRQESSSLKVENHKLLIPKHLSKDNRRLRYHLNIA